MRGPCSAILHHVSLVNRTRGVQAFSYPFTQVETTKCIATLSWDMNDENGIPLRFPKVESPYFRSEDENGNYSIDPYSVKPKFSWVFDRADEVEAVEKIAGTNCAVKIEDGEVVEAATRLGNRSMQRVEPYGNRDHQYTVRGIQNSVNRGYLSDYEWVDDGWFFGELVGPKFGASRHFDGNPHGLDERLFIPFEWLRDKCQYESYGKYSTEYDAMRDWFCGEENGLWSLFANRMHGINPEEARPDHGTFVEGIVFVHPDFDGKIRTSDLTTGNDGPVCKDLAKVRRDMFPGWYEDWPGGMNHG